MLTPNISVYLPEPGVRAADATENRVMKLPNVDTAGATFIKRPVGTPWNAFSAGAWNQQGGRQVGYYVVSEDDTTSTFRVPLFDNPGNA